MSDQKISQLPTLLGQNISAGDWIPIVDISANATKKFNASHIGGWVTPEEFGAVGDGDGAGGGTDDTAAFISAGAAIGDSGLGLRLRRGATYNIATRPTESEDSIIKISGGNFVIDGQGATLDMSGAGSNTDAFDSDTLVSVEGSEGSNIAVSGSLSATDTTITTGSAHGLSVGDTILVWQDFNYGPEYPWGATLNERNAQKGQMCTVKTVTSTTVVEVWQEIWQDMNSSDATVNIRKITLAENFQIKDLNILGVGRNATNGWRGDTGIKVKYASVFDISGVAVRDCDYRGIWVATSSQGTVDKCRVEFPPQGATNTSASQHGISVSDGSDAIRVMNSTLLGGEHGVLFAFTEGQPGIGRNCVVMNNVVYGTWSDGITSFSCAERITVSFNFLQGCVGGIEMKTPIAIVAYNQLYSCGGGIRMSQNPRYHIYQGNYIEKGNYGIRLAVSSSLVGNPTVGKIFISDNMMVGQAQRAIQVRPNTYRSTGTATSGAASALVIPDPAFNPGNQNGNGTGTPDDNYFVGMQLTITGGTSSGDVRTITGWDYSTLTLTVDSAFTSTPDATSTFEILEIAESLWITSNYIDNCADDDIQVTGSWQTTVISNNLISSDDVVAAESIVVSGDSDINTIDLYCMHNVWVNKNAPNISDVSGTQYIDNPVQGQRLISDGTAAAPSVSFADDTNTGMYREGADSIGFSVAGTLQMTVQESSGSPRVGVGEDNPESELHIKGTAVTGASYSSDAQLIVEDSSAVIQIVSDPTDTGRILFGDDANAGAGRIAYDHSTDLMSFFAGTTNRMELDINGNLQVDGRIKVDGAVPSSASDTGTVGQIAVDANYIYVCTATNTWKRVAIATW
jgi:hypothetical protein